MARLRAALALLPLLLCAPSWPSTRVVRDSEQLRLESRSGYQTVSMLDGGRTGLYYDAPELLLRGRDVSDVVLLGLGGGEMLRAVRRAHPSARLTGVEVDPGVAELARSTFGMEHLGVNVVVADAQRWVERQPIDSYDAVLVDVYDDSTMPEWVTGRLFLWRCELLLRHRGLIAINVHNDPLRVTSTLDELKALGFTNFGALVFKTNTIISAVRP